MGFLSNFSVQQEPFSWHSRFFENDFLEAVSNFSVWMHHYLLTVEQVSDFRTCFYKFIFMLSILCVQFVCIVVDYEGKPFWECWFFAGRVIFYSASPSPLYPCTLTNLFLQIVLWRYVILGTGVELRDSPRKLQATSVVCHWGRLSCRPMWGLRNCLSISSVTFPFIVSPPLSCTS